MIGEVGDSVVGTWRERLATWKEMLEREKLSEQLNSSRATYVVEFDMKEVEKSLRKDVVEKSSETEGTRALWISKRWWRYRPKLPYTYFLQKLDSSEVQLYLTSSTLVQIWDCEWCGICHYIQLSFLNRLQLLSSRKI